MAEINAVLNIAFSFVWLSICAVIAVGIVRDWRREAACLRHEWQIHRVQCVHCSRYEDFNKHTLTAPIRAGQDR